MKISARHSLFRVFVVFGVITDMHGHVVAMATISDGHNVFLVPPVDVTGGEMRLDEVTTSER